MKKKTLPTAPRKVPGKGFLGKGEKKKKKREKKGGDDGGVTCQGGKQAVIICTLQFVGKGMKERKGRGGGGVEPFIVPFRGGTPICGFDPRFGLGKKKARGKKGRKGNHRSREIVFRHRAQCTRKGGFFPSALNQRKGKKKGLRGGSEEGGGEEKKNFNCPFCTPSQKGG